ncbi:uncharacterized protein B0I36DRAFT_366561 [Microdochium trichocladiopsis]|uniref:Uncharacterized protein n=1 Tax=Microdochium trichocladiopsis TaxID=1682393 RepID=A0A9P8XXH0_9PEZI|nr:uncharacterized protein B0I36DRAFT_366561 [Microdochium trichocladiopsis]KAH7024631.1 hypothetical protein B0I36DRAFT_366561 [Microdochium trichocladiopsis]
MPAYRHSPTPTMPTAAITARAGSLAPLTTTFTPDAACATPLLYACTLTFGLDSQPSAVCMASVNEESHCTQSLSCYPEMGDILDSYTYSPANICPVGFSTAGYRKGWAAAPPGVVCCPTGYKWNGVPGGGYVSCVRSQMTEGTLAVIVGDTTDRYTTCTPKLTTMTFGPNSTASIEYITLFETETAYGFLQVSFRADGILLQGHTLTGSFTNLLSTTVSTSKTSSSTDGVDFGGIPLGGGGDSASASVSGGFSSSSSSSSSPPSDPGDDSSNRLGIGISVPIVFIILATFIACLVRRAKTKQKMLQRAGRGEHGAPVVLGEDGSMLPAANGGKAELQAGSSSAVFPSGPGQGTRVVAKEKPEMDEDAALRELDGQQPRAAPELDSSGLSPCHESSANLPNQPDPVAMVGASSLAGDAQHVHQYQPPQSLELGGDARSELYGNDGWYLQDQQQQGPYEVSGPDNDTQQQAQLNRELYLRQQIEAIRAQEQQLTQELEGLRK